jgi:hypothetical protein
MKVAVFACTCSPSTSSITEGDGAPPATFGPVDDASIDENLLGPACTPHAEDCREGRCVQFVLNDAGLRCAIDPCAALV